MQKAILRREMLQKRAQYTAAEVTSLSQQISDLFFKSFSLTRINTLHVFLPMQQKNEVDTWLIIRRLRIDYPQIRIAVPVAHTQDLSLSHFLLTPETRLKENKWGITEPEGAEEAIVEEIDLVLVPLLAFDAQGHRVGYGKGFYDRFLNACRSDAFKVGLSLEGSVHRIDDVHAGDVRLDYVVTPTDVISFKA